MTVVIVITIDCIFAIDIASMLNPEPDWQCHHTSSVSGRNTFRRPGSNETVWFNHFRLEASSYSTVVCTDPYSQHFNKVFVVKEVIKYIHDGSTGPL